MTVYIIGVLISYILHAIQLHLEGGKLVKAIQQFIPVDESIINKALFLAAILMGLLSWAGVIIFIMPFLFPRKEI